MKTTSPTQTTRLSALTAAYYLSFIILGLLTAAEGPALPALAQNTSSTLDQISLIFVFGSFGYMLGSYFGGQALDRLSGHRLVAVDLLVMTACAFTVPLARQLWQLLLVLFIFGLAKGALDVSCNTLLLWAHGKKAGPFINGLHFFFGAGAFIAPLILAGIVSLTGAPLWAFWFFGALCLPMAIWMWFLPGPRGQPTSSETGKPAFPILAVTLLALSFVFYVGAEVGFGNWIYTYAITLGLGDTFTAAYLTSAFWGTFTLGRLLGVWTSTKARAAAILFIDLLGCLLSLGLILLWGDSATALWIGTIGLGLFMASVFPTILILAGERMAITGTVTGWFLVGTGAGGMILPWSIGQAFTRIGAQAMPILVILAVIANILTIALFVYRPAAKTQSA